jgi:hypothetical protein
VAQATFFVDIIAINYILVCSQVIDSRESIMIVDTNKPHVTAVIDADGSQRWHVDGKLHRLDGPAVIDADGSQRWHVDGKLHRLDGPAVIDADG